MTFPDNRAESLPHEHANVPAARTNGELVLEEIQSTRLSWLLSESGKVPIDYATEVKKLWNLFDKRIGKPPDIGEVKDEQQARRALRLMEDALTGLLTLDDTPPSETPPEQPAVGPEQRMTWQEAAERMERLRKHGEAFTSQQKLAATFGCSPATINKAIKNTPSLQTWAWQQSATAPRAQSINPVVTDHTAQSRELDPADEVAIREYLEREDLTRDERAFFNSLSPEDQLDLLNDPDKNQRILGRKP